MPGQPVDIFIRSNSTHNQIINSLAPLFAASVGDQLDLYIDLDSTFIYPDHLLLVSAAINSAIARGVEVHGEIYCRQECKDYVSRMNFFDSVGINFEENFVRQDAAGRFLEISQFRDDVEANRLVNSVINILKAQELTDETILSSLSFCLAELVGNVIEHSSVDNVLPLASSGWIVAQYYPKRRAVRVLVADNGRGIHSALTTNPKNEKYKLYTPKQSVEECVIQGVTNGKGLGNGLYATANFVDMNGGELLIHSGTWALRYTKGRKTISPTHNWQGTYVFLEINSNVPVETKRVLNGYTGFVDDYREWFPNEPIQNDNVLW